MTKVTIRKKIRKISSIIQSTLASAFGVQSQRKQERDFREGQASHFIIAGIVFTSLFVAILVTLATLVTG